MLTASTERENIMKIHVTQFHLNVVYDGEYGGSEDWGISIEGRIMLEKGETLIQGKNVRERIAEALVKVLQEKGWDDGREIGYIACGTDQMPPEKAAQGWFCRRPQGHDGPCAATHPELKEP